MKAEGRQWTLYRLTPVVDKVTKEKKSDWQAIGFYGNITQVFNRCVDEELKLCKDIQEIVKRIAELDKYFKSKLEANLYNQRTTERSRLIGMREKLKRLWDWLMGNNEKPCGNI